MRIAFLVDAFPVLSETFILNQITGLMDLGHEVHIFAAMHSIESKVQPEVEEYGLMGVTHFYNKKSNCPVCRVFRAIVPFFKYVFQRPKVIFSSLNVFKYGKEALSLNYFYKAVSFLEQGDFDILQCHFGRNGELGGLLKEIGIKGKLVTMLHGYGIRKGIEEGAKIYERLFEQGDIFLSISDYNRKHLLKFGVPSDKIIDHPVGIDLSKFSENPRYLEGPLRVLTVARLVPEKDLKLALCGVNAFLKGNKGALEYNIVGEGPLREELISTIEELGLSENVKLAGAMEYDELIDEYYGSHVFLLTSRDEALPIVLMEAQASGMPVIATDVGSVSQAFSDGNSGFLIPANNPDAVKDKLDYFFLNRDKIVSMGCFGRDFVQDRYDVKKLNTKLEIIYKGLLNG